MFISQAGQTKYYSNYTNGRKSNCQLITYNQFNSSAYVDSKDQVSDVSGAAYAIGELNVNSTITGKWKEFRKDVTYSSEWSNGVYVKGEGKILQADGGFKVFTANMNQGYILTDDFIRDEPKIDSCPAKEKVWSE